MDFGIRARNLVVYTKEALAFLLIAEKVRFANDGGLVINPDSASELLPSEDEEIRDAYEKAETLGRVFSRAGTPATIFSMWGVKP